MYVLTTSKNGRLVLKKPGNKFYNYSGYILAYFLSTKYIYIFLKTNSVENPFFFWFLDPDS